MPNPKPLSPVMNRGRSDLCLDIAALPFDMLRSAGKQVGGSLNDAFISLVLDTIDRYHERYGTACDKIRIHMPINIRDAATADRAGNQFVPARIVMNVGDDDAEGRLRRVSKHLAAVREEPALRWVNSVSAAIQRLGVPISRRVIGGMMKGVDVLASNVAGPPCPLYLAGEHVEEFYAFGPPAGRGPQHHPVQLRQHDPPRSHHCRCGHRSRRQFMTCLDDAIAEMTGLASKWSKPSTSSSGRSTAARHRQLTRRHTTHAASALAAE